MMWMHREFFRGLLLALMLCASVALGQDSLGPQPKKARTAADYKPQTLKQVAAEEAKSAGAQKGVDKVFVHGDLRPTRVRVTYAGRSRPLPKVKKAVLNRWAQLYAGAPTHYTVPYQTELLFKEDGVGYWLAVRKDSVVQFKKEFKKGDGVNLFIVRLGGTMTNRKWESLLLVENFQNPITAILRPEFPVRRLNTLKLGRCCSVSVCVKGYPLSAQQI